MAHDATSCFSQQNDSGFLRLHADSVGGSLEERCGVIFGSRIDRFVYQDTPASSRSIVIPIEIALDKFDRRQACLHSSAGNKQLCRQQCVAYIIGSVESLAALRVLSVSKNPCRQG